MSTVEEVETALEEINAIVTNVSADVDSLIAQIAVLVEQGGIASQADIDALHTSALAIKAALNAVDAKEPPTEG